MRMTCSSVSFCSVSNTRLWCTLCLMYRTLVLGCWCNIHCRSLEQVTVAPSGLIFCTHITNLKLIMFARQQQLAARRGSARHPCALLSCTTARPCIAAAHLAQNRARRCYAKCRGAMTEQHSTAASAAPWAVPLLAVRANSQHCRIVIAKLCVLYSFVYCAAGSLAYSSTGSPRMNSAG